MIEIFVVDRIENEYVILQSLFNDEIFNVLGSSIVGNYKEKSVVIKRGNEYIFSEEETLKREQYIGSKLKRLLD